MNYRLCQTLIAAAACSLCALAPGACAQQNAGVIQVDATANQHPISPGIYGVSFGGNVLKALNLPFNRSGGNSTTTYNWKQNASNHAADWYYESIPDEGTGPGASVDGFIQRTLAAGGQPMVTIPMIGWVAKLGPGNSKLASFSIAKYGPQTGHDQYMPDAGNGTLASTGKPVTGNDPNDANMPADATYQVDWVKHLVQKWGTPDKGGVKYFLLDNEPSLWQSTHRDIHPVGSTAQEILDRMVDYSTHIKAADPGALIVGPEEWGWTGYLFSGADQQYGTEHGWAHHPDRDSHGGEEYLPWLLDQLRQRSAAAGVRLLDVFTVHYYPQGGEFGDNVSRDMQLRRNRSTRSLWDPNYVDESWIHDRIMLIPRLKQWVDQHYRGTQIGLTEYSWGAEKSISGATAQADVLGIFGREGLDFANRWTAPPLNTPTALAFKMYRNYDGQGSTFGDVSVHAAVPNPDELSAFAARRTADGALTIMAINKDLDQPASIDLSLAHFAAGPAAQAYQLTSANRIDHLADVNVKEGHLLATLPAQSITLFVIPHAG